MFHDGDDNFVREFQRRRVRMLRYFGFSMLLMILALVCLQLSDGFVLFASMEDLNWSALATSQGIASLIFAIIGFNQYRCPACDVIVRGHDRYYLGVRIDPEKCPNCGKRLK